MRVRNPKRCLYGAYNVGQACSPSSQAVQTSSVASAVRKIQVAYCVREILVLNKVIIPYKTGVIPPESRAKIRKRNRLLNMTALALAGYMP